ncbi:tyrosine-type recombinase/integrase [Roseomonas sp. CCTCC AB2023176]|uniref:tyrosine-type recombinase/integrase n=1 Tax=Roseomonas sp. CCTCC AB2023176 TaxID=3342640 RepID=UPI0035E1FD28
MKEPKGVYAVRRKRQDGTEATYFYHRPTNTRLSPDPEERRHEAMRLNGEAPPHPSLVSGSLAWTIDRYKTTEEWANLEDSSRKEYGWHLDKLAEEFGDLPVAAIGREGVKEYRKALIAAGQPYNTWHRLKKLRMVLNYARLELGLLRDDPFEGVDIPSPPRRDAVWSPEDAEVFLQHAPPLIRRGFMLAAFTTQRPADCLNMSYDCVGQTVERDGRRVLWIMLRQRKTDVPVWVPLHPALHAEIATRLHPKSNLIAPSPTGRVWDLHNFAREFRSTRIEAGLPDGLQFRDLRRTGMVRLAEAGASVPQIAAISGHSIEQTQKILEHYLPRNRHMALGGMDLLIERTGTIRRGFVLLQGGKGDGEGSISQPEADLRNGTDSRN